MLSVRMLGLAILLAGLLLGTGCSHGGAQPVTQGLGAPEISAAFWGQDSQEYQGLTRMAYTHATRQLEQALSDPSWSAAVEQQDMVNKGLLKDLEAAVILDIDETVLNNSLCYAHARFQGRDMTSRDWDEWTEMAVAPALPGAVAFVNGAMDKGVHVFMVTNRWGVEREVTAINLRRMGFNVRDKLFHLVFKNDAPSRFCHPPQGIPRDRAVSYDGWENPVCGWPYKGARRAAIARNYRILLLVGDSQGDFYSTPPEPWMDSQTYIRLLNAELTPQERFEILDTYGHFYDDRWIQLPNAYYGHWLGSRFRYRGLGPEERARVILETMEGQWREVAPAME
ncbi:MAG: hypothetical protein KKE73_15990 [Proteobacteria bacterium]|nr:hypothetical protein [Pseudomonadota bacterium]